MQDYTLLNPGPVNVSQNVRNALLNPDICHREIEYIQLQNSIRNKLLQAFHLDPKIYTSAIVTGSGTAALEMTISSVLPPNKSLLIVNNGVYGARILKIAQTYQLQHYQISFQWSQTPDVQLIEKLIHQYPDIQAIAIVHHETTTGLINPIDNVAQLASKFQKILIVDSISGLAGENFDFQKINPDFVVSTSNKCIQGFPGLSFTLFKRQLVPRIKLVPQRNLYLNLYQYWSHQENHQVLFTPAVQIAFALNAALDELIQETVSLRIQRYQNIASILRNAFQKLELRFFLQKNQQSNTITSLYIPKNFSYSSLHLPLKQAGFVIYQGQSFLSNSIFRIANMGHIPKEKILLFIQKLSQILKQ